MEDRQKTAGDYYRANYQAFYPFWQGPHLQKKSAWTPAGIRALVIVAGEPRFRGGIEPKNRTRKLPALVA